MSLHSTLPSLWKTHIGRSVSQYKRFVLHRHHCSKRNLHRGTKFKNKQTTTILSQFSHPVVFFILLAITLDANRYSIDTLY